MIAAMMLYACQAEEQGNSQQGQSRSSETSETTAELGPKVAKIMDSSAYRYGEWGYLEVDPSNGRTVRALGPADRLYIPGSAAKLFSVSATLDALGFDHRFKTPLYAQGKVNNGKLDGDLVLVAKGDMTMGGRTAPDGSVVVAWIDTTGSIKVASKSAGSSSTSQRRTTLRSLRRGASRSVTRAATPNRP